MKLSIIVTIYRAKKDLEKYIDRISSLKSKNYELIFIINTNNDDSLKIIDQFKEKTKVNVKVAFNSRRMNDNIAKLQGVELASGDYVMFHSLTNQYQEDMVATLLKEIKLKNSDIIEFKPWFSSPMRWKPNIRKNFNKPVNISEKPEVFAYTYPFSLNKIFKRELFEKFDLIPYLSSASSTFSIEFVYKLFLIATTYSTMAISPVKARKYLTKSFNPLKTMREFDLITSSDIYKKYYEEIQYNRYFLENLLFWPLVKETKNKVLIEKFALKAKKHYAEEDFFTLNKYYLLNNAEVKKLKNIDKKSYGFVNDKK